MLRIVECYHCSLYSWNAVVNTQRILSGVPIIEDCATALGSYVGNNKKHVGNIANISVMSFYATKFCSMGYGGLVMTQDKQLDERITNYREFDCVEEYEPRLNFQVSDLNSALGRSQLRKANLYHCLFILH